jgi:hypothetical protein
VAEEERPCLVVQQVCQQAVQCPEIRVGAGTALRVAAPRVVGFVEQYQVEVARPLQFLPPVLAHQQPGRDDREVGLAKRRRRLIPFGWEEVFVAQWRA